jgi:hypothetical protein
VNLEPMTLSIPPWNPKSEQSTAWNAHRHSNLDRLNATGVINHPDVVLIESNDTGAQRPWYRVSRHAGGVKAAYVVQNKLRKRWPQLEFKVVNTEYDEHKPWDAEIWARR